MAEGEGYREGGRQGLGGWCCLLEYVRGVLEAHAVLVDIHRLARCDGEVKSMMLRASRCHIMSWHRSIHPSTLAGTPFIFPDSLIKPHLDRIPDGKRALVWLLQARDLCYGGSSVHQSSPCATPCRVL